MLLGRNGEVRGRRYSWRCRAPRSMHVEGRERRAEPRERSLPGDQAVAEAMSRRERMSYEAESSLNYDYVLRDRGALQVGKAESGEARQVVGRGARASTKEKAVAVAGDKGGS